MRILFLGTPRAAVPSLKSILDAGHEVVLVISQPDRPQGRSRRPVEPPVKRCALERGLEVVQPTRLRNQAFYRALAERAPDVLVVVAYGRILARPVLEVAPLGAVNLHFSLLPRYRGAAPVQWALANGENATGVTTMLINERMDEGDLLLQQEVPIGPGVHAPELEVELSRIGADLLLRTLAGLAAGKLEGRPQDPSLATLAPILSRADGEVDLTLPAREVEGRVRGFDPWPGVWVQVKGSAKRLRLLEARALDEAGEEPPGMVLALRDQGLIVACGSGSRLLVAEVQPEGRRRQTAAAAVNGRQIRPGDRLEVAAP